MKRRVVLVLASLYTIVALVGALAATAGAQPSHVTIVWAHTSPSSLGRFGGPVEVTASFRGASSCRLEVTSSQPFPVGYSQAWRACTSGQFSARVVIGANPTTSTRTVSFALLARQGASAASYGFAVEIAGVVPTTTVPSTTTTSSTPTTGLTSSSSTTTTTSASTATSAPLPPPPPPSPTTTATVATTSTSTTSSTTSTTSATTTTAITNIQGSTSQNWSGYATTAGPFTSAQGTFTVPALTSAATCTEELSEWVGIDGFSNADLIQAGVGESMVGPYDNETCTPGHFYVWAWWEILPASMTPVSMTVQAGDVVTVAISEVSPGEWDIKVTDVTENEVVNQVEAYTAPLSSAEWVVEAPYDSYVCGGYCIPAAYSPAVPFSAVAYTGSASTAYDIVMAKSASGQLVDFATPNRVLAWPSAFGVTYTGQGVDGPRSPALARAMVGRPAAGRHLSHRTFEG